MTNPTVDILMATYNGENYINDQIESIQMQTYPHWRILISDDDSTDRTPDIVSELSNSDSRIEVVSKKTRHGSAKSNFYSLLDFVDAEYVMFCDQDDVWLRDKIERTLAAMREVENHCETVLPVLCFTDMVVVDSALNVMDRSFFKYSHIDPKRTRFEQVLAQSVGAGCTMMMNRRLVELALESKDYIEQMIMHDWWIALIAAAFGILEPIEVATSQYRQHNSNEIGAAVYSPTRRLVHYGAMVESAYQTVIQAEAFLSCFEESLSAKQIETLVKYSSLSRVGIMDAYANLISCGAWKRGLRKMGQLITIPGIIKLDKERSATR